MSLEKINLGYAYINMTLQDVKPKKNDVKVNRRRIARAYRTKRKEHKTNIIFLLLSIERNL